MRLGSAYSIAISTILGLLLGAGLAEAACPAVPNTLTNGQAADAIEVMENFDAVRDCVDDVGIVSSGTVGQIGYYNSTGKTISGKSLSEILDSALSSAQGSLLYRSVSGWVALAPGSTGYVLQTGGLSGNPSWVAPGGGGGGGIGTIVGAGRSSSSSVVALPMIPPISRPALSAFSWLNQASATAAEYPNGPLVLKTSQDTGGNSVNSLIKSVAGSNWSVTMHYALGNQTGGPNKEMVGLVVYNSANGRLYVCGIDTTATIGVWAYASSTSWAGAPGSKIIAPNYSSVWTKAKYVSATTTMEFSYSVDGFNWEPIYSTSSPYVGVATHYGISVGTQSNYAGKVISLDYMSESSP